MDSSLLLYSFAYDASSIIALLLLTTDDIHLLITALLLTCCLVLFLYSFAYSIIALSTNNWYWFIHLVCLCCMLCVARWLLLLLLSLRYKQIVARRWFMCMTAAAVTHSLAIFPLSTSSYSLSFSIVITSYIAASKCSYLRPRCDDGCMCCIIIMLT